eukprot:TRINITY_DN2587_c0_g1_i2.p1 TRINITY_DN2587_c0_g1~~TRINITY_DN2587_c0_g1_i2.p1  ORF type:complete len:175 (-),score=11.46 TRINITY_DN2587_c0_g1_i2:88-612(-)
MPRFKAVVFDLDGLIWHPDMWLCGGPPFHAESSDCLRDRSKKSVRLHDGVMHALSAFHDPSSSWHGVPTCIASCTDEPSWARQCLDLFRVNSRPLGDWFPQHLRAIHKGTKDRHLRQLAATLRIEPSEIVFLDNESHNITVAQKIGVHAVFCPDGLTVAAWDRITRDHMGETVA